MKYNSLILSALLLIFFSCKKDKGNDNILEYQKELNHEWTPVIKAQALLSSSVLYKIPAECEKDNIYTFSFGSTFTMNLNRSQILCPDDTQGFESNFGNQNNFSWTYNNDRKSLITKASPYEEGYEVELENNILTLTYYNTNPAANYVPAKYQFKKVGTSCNDCL